MTELESCKLAALFLFYLKVRSIFVYYMGMTVKKLTDKQKTFVQEYLVDLNATQASIRAGYSEKTAKQIGTENLAKPAIADAIAEAQAKRKERTEINQDYVLQKIQLVGERCIQEVNPVLTPAGKQVVDKKGNPLFTFNANGANKSFEMLGKHLGMFTEKVEINEIGMAERMLKARKRVKAKEDEQK